MERSLACLIMKSALKPTQQFSGRAEAVRVHHTSPGAADKAVALIRRELKENHTANMLNNASVCLLDILERKVL